MMKKKLTSNLTLKILSIVVAFVFWLLVVNQIDPVTTKTFYSIPVKILNENVITSADQVYEIESGDKVNVVVKGKRSVIERLSASDFSATVDLSELSKVNAVSIQVALKKNLNEEIELSTNNAVMKVKLEERMTDKFKVEVEHQGELSDNYMLGEIVAKPNIIEVSCGKSKFKKIDHVGVTVTLNGESANFQKDYSPILYDKDGGIIDNTNVTFSNDSITVVTHVLSTKTIPITIDVQGTPAEGYRVSGTDYKPEEIHVAGSEADLAKLSSIKIPIDVSGAKKDIEKDVPLVDYINNLTVVDNITSVSVHCDIVRKGTRSFVMTDTDIAVKGLPSNTSIEFENESEKHSVTLIGKESVLENMDLNSLGAYINLAGLSVGAHTIEVGFNLPDSVKLKSKVKVNIILRAQNSTDTDSSKKNNTTNNTDSTSNDENTATEEPQATEEP